MSHIHWTDLVSWVDYIFDYSRRNTLTCMTRKAGNSIEYMDAKIRIYEIHDKRCAMNALGRKTTIDGKI